MSKRWGRSAPRADRTLRAEADGDAPFDRFADVSGSLEHVGRLDFELPGLGAILEQREIDADVVCCGSAGRLGK